MTSAIRVVLIGLLFSLRAPLFAQSTLRPSPFELSAMLLDKPQPGGTTRLWLVIKNTTSAAHVLCRSFWSYTLIPADPKSTGSSEAEASLHGCGDDEHDPFWLLLPGESRFDSYEMKSLPEGDYELQVEVEVVERPFDSSADSVQTTLYWKGTLSDAVSYGRKLIAGQPE